METWRKNVEEMWDDLIELMETRRQMLQSTFRKHKYSVDAKEILDRLEQKDKLLDQTKDPNQIIHEIQSLNDKVSRETTCAKMCIQYTPNFLSNKCRQEKGNVCVFS